MRQLVGHQWTFGALSGDLDFFEVIANQANTTMVNRMPRTPNVPIDGVRPRRLSPTRLGRCIGGNVALEFAFIAPILITVVIGILELALIVFVTVLLESGVREGARYGFTGQTTIGVTREDQIVSIITEKTLGLVDITTDDVTVKVYPSFAEIYPGDPFDDINGDGDYDPLDGETYTDANGNGQYDPDVGVPGAGGPGEIVLYQVDAEYELFTPLISSLLGNDGTIILTASIAVRNEPF